MQKSLYWEQDRLNRVHEIVEKAEESVQRVGEAIRGAQEDLYEADEAEKDA
jgi:hypothetical protein